MSSRHRRWIWLGRKVWLLARLSLGLVLGAVLFDRVVMPAVVRHGSDTIVPAVTGRTWEEVTRLLRIAALVPGEVQEVSDPNVPAGEAVAQDPPAGTRVRKNRAVQILISSGAPARRVPDLLGMTERHARLELSQRGLKTGVVAILEANRFRQGEVVATRPAPGRLPDRGGAVDLLIARRPSRNLFVMPDLRGRDWRQAASRLRRLGLRVSRWGEAERVAFQDPAPGEPVWSGMTVLLE